MIKINKKPLTVSGKQTISNLPIDSYFRFVNGYKDRLYQYKSINMIENTVNCIGYRDDEPCPEICEFFDLSAEVKVLDVKIDINIEIYPEDKNV